MAKFSPRVGFTLCCFVVYSTRRFVLSLVLCYFVLVFFSPFSIAITPFREERAYLSAFRTIVRFALVWFCRFPVPLGVWDGLRLVIVALPRLFSFLCFFFIKSSENNFFIAWLDKKKSSIQCTNDFTGTLNKDEHIWAGTQRFLQNCM